ncbi:hypothetical protein J6590_023627 [Homalodisca vitripennis]|nr:hypothetical protein J6590_023627 [Homalodisca vitripennis]
MGSRRPLPLTFPIFVNILGYHYRPLITQTPAFTDGHSAGCVEQNDQTGKTQSAQRNTDRGRTALHITAAHKAHIIATTKAWRPVNSDQSVIVAVSDTRLSERLCQRLVQTWCALTINPPPTEFIVQRPRPITQPVNCITARTNY